MTTLTSPSEPSNHNAWTGFLYSDEEASYWEKFKHFKQYVWMFTDQVGSSACLVLTKSKPELNDGVKDAIQVLEAIGEVGSKKTFDACIYALCNVSSQVYAKYPELRTSIVGRLMELSLQKDFSQYESVSRFAEKLIDEVYYEDNFVEADDDLDLYDFLTSKATNK